MAEQWSCPLPLRDHERITLGHGGGALLTAELVEHLFLPAFGDAAAGATRNDAAVLPPRDGGIAVSTDGYVVQPLFFPGGDIGQLAVYGTVNDLAMVGARPTAMTAAFVLEEGLLLEDLGRVATSMGHAASRAGVQLVAGDTKVVEKGSGDGLYITTTGIGVVPPGRSVDPSKIEIGDHLIVSGDLGLHGIAVLSVREGLSFGTSLESDCAPLNALVEAMLSASPNVHALRDLTRGGLGTALCEIARSAGVGIVYDEASLPIPTEVGAACELFGLDAVHVANEGKLVAFVSPESSDAVLGAMRSHPLGRDATVIGEVTERHAGQVAARTPFGAHGIVTPPLGEQLPRIC